jgi:hypothetical protein
MRKLVLLVTLVLGTTSWLACEAMDGDVLSPESEALLSAIGEGLCPLHFAPRTATGHPMDVNGDCIVCEASVDSRTVTVDNNVGGTPSSTPCSGKKF